MKLHKLLLICFTLLFAKPIVAQQPKITSIINFTGTIGTYPIEMQLNLVQNTTSVSGKYYYLKSGSEKTIFLKGSFKNGTLLLEESAYNSQKKDYLPSGYFNLTFNNNTTITGSWGKNKKEALIPNALKVKLTCREQLNAFNPFKFKYILTKKKADYEDITEVASAYYAITSLTIDNNRIKPLLIKGFKEKDLVDDNPDLELEDMNFDGYLDLKIMINYPDAWKGDYSYLYYIYDKVEKNFVKSNVLNDLGVLSFDASSKTTYKYDADGSGNEGTTTYKWHNKMLLITKEERVYENDIYTHYKEYKISNGESVETKSYKKK